MHFTFDSRVVALQERINEFLEQHIYPAESSLIDAIENSDDRWRVPDELESLKARAREAGLWNFFMSPEMAQAAGMPESASLGLSNLEYAPLSLIHI